MVTSALRHSRNNHVISGKKYLCSGQQTASLQQKHQGLEKSKMQVKLMFFLSQSGLLINVLAIFTGEEAGDGLQER